MTSMLSKMPPKHKRNQRGKKQRSPIRSKIKEKEKRKKCKMTTMECKMAQGGLNNKTTK